MIGASSFSGVVGRVVLFMLCATSGACDQRVPTAPEPSGTALRAVSAAIVGLDEPLAAGASASLQVVATMSDGSQVSGREGAIWTSADPDVARVDDSGVLHAMSEGQAVIHVAVKNANASATATVVMNVAGEWQISWVPAACPISFIPGCVGLRFVQGPPPVQRDVVALQQSGDRVSGNWFVPVDGRISPDGRLVLNGRRCQVGDSSPGETEVAILGWEMDRMPDRQTFRGRAHWETKSYWEQQGLCSGSPRGTGYGGELVILDFVRR